MGHNLRPLDGNNQKTCMMRKKHVLTTLPQDNSGHAKSRGLKTAKVYFSLTRQVYDESTKVVCSGAFRNPGRWSGRCPEHGSCSQRTRECRKVHTGKSSSPFFSKFESYGPSRSNVVTEGRVSSDRRRKLERSLTAFVRPQCGAILNPPEYETSKTLTINQEAIFYPVPEDYGKKTTISSLRVEDRFDNSATSTIYFQRNKIK